MRLNIIGNWFDLYHGLPCSYYYFGCFLAKYYSDFYVEMSQMFGFSCYRRVGYEEVEIIVDNIFWRTFEEGLSELDSTWMEDLGLSCGDCFRERYRRILEETNAYWRKEKAYL